jgi:hypothetical protein
MDAPENAQQYVRHALSHLAQYEQACENLISVWDQWLENAPDVNEERISTLEDKTIENLLGKEQSQIEQFISQTIENSHPKENISIKEAETLLAKVNVAELAISELKDELINQCNDASIAFWYNLSLSMHRFWVETEQRMTDLNIIEEQQDEWIAAGIEAMLSEIENNNLSDEFLMDLTFISNPKWRKNMLFVPKNDDSWVEFFSFLSKAEHGINVQLHMAIQAFIFGSTLLDFDIPPGTVLH